MNFKNTEKVVKVATLGIIAYLLCFGIAEAFFPIRPFWNDEWRLIYNVKFKTVSGLWGQLDLLQQCPRVYLSVLKMITSAFDYSYTSLRLPALVLTFINVFFCLHLRKKLLPGKPIYSYLFILIFISSQTFTDYMVQFKHYEMDIFLCLLALWQLITLLDLSRGGRAGIAKYLLLCVSFLAVPYFSYIYPIAIAPIFPVIILSAVITPKEMQTSDGKKTPYLTLAFPLLLVCISIIIFYLVDVKQLMADNRMYASYKNMLSQEKVANNYLTDFWNLFALVGSGVVFEGVFGILGVIAFFYGIYRLAKIKLSAYTKNDYIKLYGIVLLFVTLVLIVTGKLMGGVARLAVFTVPSISLLIVCFINDLKHKFGYIKVANTTTTILFLALFGNIISTCINTFTYPEYSNRIKTFRHTKAALELARTRKLPLLFTIGVRGDIIPDIALPTDHLDSNTITQDQIAGATSEVCAEVILKVNPGFRAADATPLYLMPGMKWAYQYVQQLPSKYTAAVVTDGINYTIINR